MSHIDSETIPILGGDDAARPKYDDLAPHAVRCDAAMAELRADVAALKDAVRTMAMDLRKLQDKLEHFDVEVADNWHLNE
jgi:hypothetical protein